MADVKKVIKGLECCAIDGGCGACPYDSFKDCPGSNPTPETLMKDALALLKAQEPVEPTIGGDADGPYKNWWYQCGKCKETVIYHDKYCRNCGQEVKWE